MRRPAASCIFCGGPDLAPQKQRIAGEPVSVCNLCASAGRLGLDRGTMQGALGCLHLTALELERLFDDQFSRQRRARRRIESSLFDGDFWRACACATCAARQVGGDLGLDDDGLSVDLFMIDGGVVMTDIPELALSALRSMPNSVAETAERKARNRAETAYEPIERYPLPRAGVDQSEVPLSKRAEPSLPWHKVGNVAQSFVNRIAAAQDDRARRYWAMLSKYGPGLRDGDYWMCRDGSLILLDEAEKAIPMSRADYEALEADKARAAKWLARDER